MTGIITPQIGVQVGSILANSIIQLNQISMTSSKKNRIFKKNCSLHIDFCLLKPQNIQIPSPTVNCHYVAKIKWKKKKPTALENRCSLSHKTDMINVHLSAYRWPISQLYPFQMSNTIPFLPFASTIPLSVNKVHCRPLFK